MCQGRALLGDESCDPCPPRPLQNTLDTTVITNSPSKMYSGRSAVTAQRWQQGECLSGLLLSPSSGHTEEQPCLREPQLSLKPQAGSKPQKQVFSRQTWEEICVQLVCYILQSFVSLYPLHRKNTISLSLLIYNS